jgi:hypothetical protein
LDDGGGEVPVLDLEGEDGLHVVLNTVDEGEGLFKAAKPDDSAEWGC